MSTEQQEKRAKKRPRRFDFAEDKLEDLPIRKDQYLAWDKGCIGLHVLVNAGGKKTYRSRYQYVGTNKHGTRALGEVGVMTLEEARKQCRKDRRLAGEGHEPKQEAVTGSDLFGDVVDEFVNRELIARKRIASAEEVRRLLHKDAARFKSRPIGSIRATEIDDLLEYIRDGDAEQRGRPYLANKAWGHMRQLFAWCVSKHKLPASPMVSTDRPFEAVKERDRVYSDDEIRELWHCPLSPLESAFLKLLILTGKRKGALADMRWGEVSESWVWTPVGGNPNKQRHPVPLPALAQRILQGIKPRDAVPSDYVFPSPLGGNKGRMRVANKLQGRVRRSTKVKDWFPHACRHTCETRLAQLRVPPHIRDMLFDHAPARGAGAGYDHWQYEDEKREALELWASYIERLVKAKGTALLR
jgi:integrase